MKATVYGVILVFVLFISISATIFVYQDSQEADENNFEYNVNPTNNQTTSQDNPTTDSVIEENRSSNLIMPVAKCSENSIVPNYSFEQGIDGFASGWTNENGSSVKAYRNIWSGSEDYRYYIWSNTSGVNVYSDYFSVVSGGYHNFSFFLKPVFLCLRMVQGFMLLC